VLYLDADIAEGVRQMLQSLGATVELCAGHDAALAILALLQWLRAELRHQQVAAVMLSAHGSA